MLIASRNSCLCNFCRETKSEGVSKSIFRANGAGTFIKSFGQFEVIKLQPELHKDNFAFLVMHQLPGCKAKSERKDKPQIQSTQLWQL